MICAALLHDTIEDTQVTYEDIRDVGFGHPIANLVRELTDVSKPEDGNRAYRKMLDRHHLANISSRGQTVKLADLIHNTVSICRYDPGFAKTYMREKALLLDVLTKGEPVLHKRARDQVTDYYER